MRTIESLAELKELAGQAVATSAWMDITQERVNQFAEATGDRQWIHIDVERCRRESPFGGTVAHGFLTLSLLPVMVDASLAMGGVRMAVNYGLNQVRFPAPLLVGSRVRGHIALQSVQDIREGVQLTWDITLEREGGDKPVCVAELITRQYY